MHEGRAVGAPLGCVVFLGRNSCATDPQPRRGLKLHFGSAALDYHNAGHIAAARKVFAAANRYGMAIAVHMRASVSYLR